MMNMKKVVTEWKSLMLRLVGTGLVWPNRCELELTSSKEVRNSCFKMISLESERRRTNCVRRGSSRTVNWTLDSK